MKLEASHVEGVDRTPWDGIIVTDADTCFGKARIAGTRYYIDHLLAGIEAGDSFDDLLDEDSGLTRAQLQAMMGSRAIWLQQSATA